MGRYNEYLRIVYASIKRRKIRNLLNFMSITVGIGAVLALILVGIGFQSSISEAFEMMGTDKIYVLPGGGIMGMGGGTLTERDLEVVERTFGVNEASGMSYKIARVEFNREVRYVFVMGLEPDTAASFVGEAQGLEISRGRNLRYSDTNHCLVGYLVGKGDVFGRPAEIGRTILIEGISFRIVGELSKIGSAEDDSSVLIPLETFDEIFNTKGEYNMILAQSATGFNASTVAEQIRENLRREHDVKKGEERFTVQTSEQMMQSFSQILSVLFLILTSIAAISLLVGGVGVMNTMYTSVLERTKEIGILKAVGARNFDILSIFVIESGMLGLIGGICGAVLGIIFAYGVAIFADAMGYGLLNVSVNPFYVIAVILFSFFIGVASGYLPAKEASKMNPCDALAYE